MAKKKNDLTNKQRAELESTSSPDRHFFLKDQLYDFKCQESTEFDPSSSDMDNQVSCELSDLESVTQSACAPEAKPDCWENAGIDAEKKLEIISFNQKQGLNNLKKVTSIGRKRLNLLTSAPVIAIDLAKHVVQLYAVTDESIINCPCKSVDLNDVLDSLPKGTVVTFEACCTSNRVGRECKAKGLIPIILSPLRVKGVRGETDKSDAADAQAIYQTLLLGLSSPKSDIKPIQVRTEVEQGYQSLFNEFDISTNRLVAAKNSFISLINEYTYLPNNKDPLGFAISYCKECSDFQQAVMNYQSAHPNTAPYNEGLSQEEIAAWKANTVYNLIYKVELPELVKLGCSSIVITFIAKIRDFTFVKQRHEALKESITAISDSTESSKNMQAVFGVGSIVAFSLMAKLAPVANILPNASAACRYIGTAPEHTGTGGKIVDIGVARGRNGSTRRVLYQGALSMVSRDRNRPGTYAYQQLKKGKNLRSVACAYCNKIVRVAFAILRDGSEFDLSLVNPITIGHQPC